MSPTPRAAYTVPLPGGRALALGPRTLVMGVLNVTPDSFADTVRSLDPRAAADRALALEADGADLIDIGGESTRPGAQPVSEAEERRRVVPVIEALAGRISVPLSIDTSKAGVAAAALDAGAVVVNDISGLSYDPALGQVVAARGAAIVLMHMRGRPKAMYQEAAYEAVGRDVARELAGSLARAAEAGIAFERIVLDPGIGFAKGPGDSFGALAAIGGLAALGRPVLVGPSRKSFLLRAIGPAEPAAREWATAGAVAAAVMLGAHIVRVHNVAAMRDVVRVVDAVVAAMAAS